MNENEIIRTLTLLLEPGQVTELRALDVVEPSYRRPHVVSGYFDDLHALARAAAGIQHAKGIYIVVNPVAPALLARAANRVRPIGREPLTSDADIVRRRWLPIDLDPLRPAGISATNNEHDAALARASMIRGVLRDRGWADPIMADSGNGGHLLYRIDLPTDDRGLVARVLAGLAFRFDDEQVHVDTTTANPARLWKLYGTLARKGDDVPDRPHRLGRVLTTPDTLTTVTAAQLEEVAAWVPTSEKSLAASVDYHDRQPLPAFDIERWIANHQLEVDGPRPWNAGRKWVFAICPWDPSHTDASAYIVEFPNGAVAAGCHHHTCAGRDWHALRTLTEPERRSQLATVPRRRDATIVTRDDVALHRTSPRTRPAQPHSLAFYGLAGEIVRCLAPTTEADPIALLLTVLSAVGNIIGNGPHWTVSGGDHSLRIWPVLVGRTSKGRKGTALSTVKPVLRLAAPDWWESRVVSGLSSGEGVIWAVRDPVFKTEPIREGGARTGPVLDYQEVMSDKGVEDKRLFVIEEEFASVLKVMTREANILSAVLRQAWDSGDLRTLTKNAPVQATGAHVTVLAHITQHELLRYLNDTEAANGFANRFLWACVERSKLLPEGGEPDPGVVALLAGRLTAVLAAATSIGRIERDPEATRLWCSIYGALSSDEPGLLGAVMSRAEAQVMRLAALYAVLDRSPLIRPAHLRAAVALWDYLAASVRYIFGDALGDPIADVILQQLQLRGDVTRTEIRDLFQRNVAAGRISQSLELLTAMGTVTRVVRDSGGRPAEVWRYTGDDSVATGCSADGGRSILSLITGAGIDDEHDGNAEPVAHDPVDHVADDDGCAACGGPLLTATERADGVCVRCGALMLSA